MADTNYTPMKASARWQAVGFADLSRQGNRHGSNLNDPGTGNKGGGFASGSAGGGKGQRP